MSSIRTLLLVALLFATVTSSGASKVCFHKSQYCCYHPYDCGYAYKTVVSKYKCWYKKCYPKCYPNCHQKCYPKCYYAYKKVPISKCDKVKVKIHSHCYKKKVYEHGKWIWKRVCVTKYGYKKACKTVYINKKYKKCKKVCKKVCKKICMAVCKYYKAYCYKHVQYKYKKYCYKLSCGKYRGYKKAPLGYTSKKGIFVKVLSFKKVDEGGKRIVKGPKKGEKDDGEKNGKYDDDKYDDDKYDDDKYDDDKNDDKKDDK